MEISNLKGNLSLLLKENVLNTSCIFMFEHVCFHNTIYINNIALSCQNMMERLIK